MPYKGIDYGDKFLLIKKDEFNFLNLTDDIDMSLFDGSDVNAKIAYFEDLLMNVRSNREYDMYSDEIERLKSENPCDDRFLMCVREAVYNGAANYGQLEYMISNPQYNVPKLISVYLKNGYDGGYYDGIYTVFNFDKLNEKFIKYDVGMNEQFIKRIVCETIREYLKDNLVE